MDWKETHTQQDLDCLLRECGYFHDSCIVSLSYQSGAGVDERLRMGMDGPQAHALNLVLQRQARPVSVELAFSGVRRFFIEGWRENYFCDIFECSLDFYSGLIDGDQTPLVVWSNYRGFDPEDLKLQTQMNCPADSYIIAESLKWRFID